MQMLSAVETETLLIWGRQDGLAPLEQGEALNSVLPNSSLDVIDNCGHLPMTEKPENLQTAWFATSWLASLRTFRTWSGSSRLVDWGLLPRM